MMRQAASATMAAAATGAVVGSKTLAPAPAAPPLPPPPLGAAESSSAVARPRVLSLMMHGGGKLRMGDAMQIDVGAPSEAARPGSSVLGKRAAYGSDGERWAERMLRTTITDDIARGCSKACGCVDAHANLADILEQRQAREKQSMPERREWFNGMLNALEHDASSTGYKLNWGNVDKPACAVGFALRHGFTKDWVYDRMRKHRVGALRIRALTRPLGLRVRGL